MTERVLRPLMPLHPMYGAIARAFGTPSLEIFKRVLANSSREISHAITGVLRSKVRPETFPVTIDTVERDNGRYTCELHILALLHPGKAWAVDASLFSP